MKAAKAAKAASKAAKGASKVAKKAPPVPPHRIKDHIELAMEGLETITDLAGVAGDVAEAYSKCSIYLMPIITGNFTHKMKGQGGKVKVLNSMVMVLNSMVMKRPRSQLQMKIMMFTVLK